MPGKLEEFFGKLEVMEALREEATVDGQLSDIGVKSEDCELDNGEKDGIFMQSIEV